MDDTRKALRDVFGTQMFENVQVLQKPQDDPAQQHLIDVEVLVKERPAKTAEIECEWAVQPGDKGRPSLASYVPGGSLLFEHRNLGGNGTQLSALITTQNFLQPVDDLGFKVDLRRPYVFGTEDPKKTSLAATAFNARKLSSVFLSNGGTEVPPVWVDRAGVKVGLSESYNRNSKGSLSVVMESVSCRDDSGAPCTAGQRTGYDGQPQSGPPTTLSDSGNDKLVFLQGDLVRDATYFKHGVLLGARDILTVDQGLGIGSAFPVFNRATLSATRFLPLDLPTTSKAPASLVLHGKVGNTVGDVASYDYFTLGGPFSCRGYNIGELGSARRFVELAAELRHPIPKTSGQVRFCRLDPERVCAAAQPACARMSFVSFGVMAMTYQSTKSLAD